MKSPSHAFHLPSSALNPREQSVADLLATGLSTDDIAKELGISASAVRVFIARAVEKLSVAGVADRHGLVRWVRAQRTAA